MYAAGALPALLSIGWRIGLPESAAFQAAKEQTTLDPFETIGRYKKHVVLIGLAYFLFWIPISPAITYPSQYLQREGGWTPAAFATLSFLAGLVGLAGTFIGGFLADRMGRKPVAIFMTLACVAGLSGIYLNQGERLIAVTMSCGLVAWFGATVALRALMTELIPTSARATLAGTSEIGATSGAVVGGGMVAFLIPILGGIGPSILAILPLVVCAVVAIWLLPETNGTRIDEVT
jgi:predicted MFS family arabinose efflux permease